MKLLRRLFTRMGDETDVEPITDADALERLKQQARALDEKGGRKLLWKALRRDPKNARLWRLYASWFEVTDKEALKAYRNALELDPRCLDDHPEGAMLNRVSGRVLKAPVRESPCLYCVHYSAGHVDRQRNWFRCDTGHRLLAQFDDCWEDRSASTGEAMFERPDCPDWKFSGARFYVPPDPWWG